MKEQAELRSGVKHDEAQNVSDLYEKIGQEKFYELSRKFYDRGTSRCACCKLCSQRKTKQESLIAIIALCP